MKLVVTARIEVTRVNSASALVQTEQFWAALAKAHIIERLDDWQKAEQELGRAKVDLYDVSAEVLK